MSSIVFDIGGTNMRVARAERGAVGNVQKVETPRDASTAVNTLIHLIDAASGGDEIAAIAGGVAGIVNPEGALVTSPNLPDWQNVPIADKLAERFGSSVYVENDAAMAALGEARYGAGKDAQIVAYLGIGTGVGGARIVDGAIDRHATGVEPGHQIIDAQTGATLERAVSGSALAAHYNADPATLPRSTYSDLTPLLAIGVWNAIVHWSPEVVVLGGSLINGENGFRVPDVAREVARLRRVLPAVPRIEQATLGDRNGLFGALTCVES